MLIEDVDVDNNNKECMQGSGILRSNNGMGSISHGADAFNENKNAENYMKMR